MTNITQWFQQLDFGVVIDLLMTVAAALVCIILHECAHGLVALWLGDKTAKQAGRLTLNPIKHVDIIGLIMLAVAKVGWAKPVPVNPNNFKHPRLGMAVTAAAGPLCNILLALVTMIFFAVAELCYQIRGGDWLCYIARFLFYVTVISCGLAAFNIIPIPPLDGSKILAVVLPPKAYAVWMRYERYGMVLLIGLVLLSEELFGNASPLDTVIYGLFNGLLQVAKYPVKAIMSLIYPGFPIQY